MSSVARGGSAATRSPVLVAPERSASARVRDRAPTLGKLGLGLLLVCTAVLVLLATAGPSNLVPQSGQVFPRWLAGPLGGLAAGLPRGPAAVSTVLSIALVVMAGAYLLAVEHAVAVSARVVVGVIVALHAVLLLSPPLQLTDVFNYLGYARLGALHGLNPYTHGIAMAQHDPVFPFSTWHHLRSPYGPLFTLGSYALAPLGLPVAYWILKLVTVAASLGCVALVWRCAQRVGRDPRTAAVFVAGNPLLLVYGLGGFHNDFLMLLPVTAAVALLLAGRDRLAGGALVLAAAVKASAGLLLPFLLIGARRRLGLLTTAALTALAMGVVAFLVFGLAQPNLGDQSTLLTGLSVPNVLGLVAGSGGTPVLHRVASAVLVLSVLGLAWASWRGRLSWIVAAGWATLVLLGTLNWLVPWYIVWALPFAALGDSRNLRRWTLLFTLFLMLTWLPATGALFHSLGFRPLDTPAGRASLSHMYTLLR